jgi:hypothetical protein
MEEYEILEVEPDPGPQAAIVSALGTGDGTKVIHDRKHGFQLDLEFSGQKTGFNQLLTVHRHDSAKGGVGLLPEPGLIPGNL